MKAKRFLAMFLVLVTLCSIMVIPASAASWRTGRIPSRGNTSDISVALNNTNKNAKIKIHGYNSNNKEKDFKLYVTMKDLRGNWIWGGYIYTGSNGKTMTLGNDHSWYQISLRHECSARCWDFLRGCPVYYGIQCTKNCTVY